MKSVISSYMIFVKELSNDVNVVHTQVGLSKEEVDLSNFLSQYQDVFTNDIPRVLSPKRGDDDHMIKLRWDIPYVCGLSNHITIKNRFSVSRVQDLFD